MEALIRNTDAANLRIIDIDRWGSPVAEQYGIRSIPALWLYEGTERVSTDTREVLRLLQE